MAAVRFLLFLPFLASLLPSLSLSQSDDEKALLKLKKSITNAKLDSWVSDSDPCQKKWLGVQCSGGSVVALHLTGLQLAGQIDVQALLQIRGLRAISFINNSFTGSIPEFNNLTSLRAIYLSQNQFSGEISNDYFYPMENLKKVWLNENKFSGKIPDSLMQLPNLIELHLESNQFSGKIPRLKNPEVINSLDLSDNKLQGEIPASFSKFEVSAFQGNDGLCGESCQKCATKLTIRIAMAKARVAKLTSQIAKEPRRWIKPKDPIPIGGSSGQGVASPIDDHHEAEEIRYEPPEYFLEERVVAREQGWGADLVMMNDEKGAFGMQDLMKAAAEVLGNGGLGSAYKAVMGNGLAVVVKRMKELNRLGKEAFDAEMKRIGKLRHPNVLTPLAYHFKKEEKLVVSEYMPKGSLSYVLHGDRGIIHANLNWPTRSKVIKGIADGLGFIHTEFATYEIPHGNLKSSNVLLNDDYVPLLSDFAFQPLTNPDCLPQSLFAYRSPEYLQTQQVSPKSDVYCLGVLILEIITGKFPSQYLSNGKGGIDIVHWVQTAVAEDQAADLIDPEISHGSSSIHQMVQLLRIGAACTETNPDQRLPLKEAIDKIHEYTYGRRSGIVTYMVPLQQSMAFLNTAKSLPDDSKGAARSAGYGLLLCLGLDLTSPRLIKMTLICYHVDLP
ncbi:Pollen receptor-like kinase 3 [Hibiscus syriacus]|uniref:Pollen receptor-like kinase 3 n=1 Tax=Hibiscus syriacus TaxID=106335 RepID=A0A6A2YAM4_HIBSY|nr:Pollen receptor-like kinase 3 [Hibiscus syriacus]